MLIYFPEKCRASRKQDSAPYHAKTSCRKHLYKYLTCYYGLPCKVDIISFLMTRCIGNVISFFLDKKSGNLVIICLNSIGSIPSDFFVAVKILILVTSYNSNRLYVSSPTYTKNTMTLLICVLPF